MSSVTSLCEGWKIKYYSEKLAGKRTSKNISASGLEHQNVEKKNHVRKIGNKLSTINGLGCQIISGSCNDIEEFSSEEKNMFISLVVGDNLCTPVVSIPGEKKDSLVYFI
jgi:uncharacterized ferredoxin-like protein